MSTKNLKILIVGNPKVGKTSLIQRYINNIFDDKSRSHRSKSKNSQKNLNLEDDDQLTADFLEKRVIIDDKEMIVSFWDQSPDQSIPPRSFFQGSHGSILVFSTIDADSLRKLEYWYETIRKYSSDDVDCPMPPIVIAENKIDLIEKSVVDSMEVEKAAKTYKLRLYRTSAKHGHQVNELFDYITAKASKFQTDQQQRRSSSGEEPILIDSATNASKIITSSSSSGDLLQKGRSVRTMSTASWTLPLATNEEKKESTSNEPSKRRTGGVKPIFNKNKCPVM